MGLFWDTNQVICDVLEVRDQYMHLRVRCTVTQQVFLATFVYHVYNVSRRRNLWEYLTLLGASITLPWIVLGDFNCFLFPQDKRGGQALTAYLFHDLQEFMMATSLVDASSSGSFYTWTNGSIWSKLDRVLMNFV
ncbi:hypothetical protein LIER_40352 [Lithospermum erythrorhizon]|uniref:Endonuclease/exonuclease/phosphatase domain-containing protein n=1 Tax=Lithospermum erythrorhizon TaxID=34254 RepID=A0AAV3QTF4_LITER